MRDDCCSRLQVYQEPGRRCAKVGTPKLFVPRPLRAGPPLRSTPGRAEARRERCDTRVLQADELLELRVRGVRRGGSSGSSHQARALVRPN